MTPEDILPVPIVQQAPEQVAAEIHAAQPRLATAEEVRAADQLFAKQEQEHQLIAGLIGMYAGSILLRDLAAEHLAHDEEDEEKRKVPKYDPQQ